MSDIELGSKESRPARFMFTGKRIRARAICTKAQPVVISEPDDKADGTGKRNPQIEMMFKIAAGQYGMIYSLPPKPETGDDPWETYSIGNPGLIPAGFEIPYLRSITDKAMEYIVDNLRTAGWQGSSLDRLAAGEADGLGEVDVFLVINAKEDTIDQAGNSVWRTRTIKGQKGEPDQAVFNPVMEIAFINSAGGVIQNKAGVGSSTIKDLDSRFGSLLKKGAVASAPAGAPKLPGLPSRVGSSATAGTDATGDALTPPGGEDVPF